MESLKIDLGNILFDLNKKKALVKKLHSMGYTGVPRGGFFYTCIYASGCPSASGYSLAFGNSAKTFSKNKFREVSVKDVLKGLV